MILRKPPVDLGSRGNMMLDFSDHVEAPPVCFDQMLLQQDYTIDPEVIMPSRTGSPFGLERRRPVADIVTVNTKPLRIGLIDCYRFSQECLVKAFGDLQPKFAVLAFSSVRDCILDAGQDFDIILYHAHASETQGIDDVVAVRQSFQSTPLIVLSDAEDAHQPAAICSILKQGAQGFVPTRTMGIPMIVAAIRFVEAGGTFAPLDLLLNPQANAKREILPPTLPNRLTSRQVAVLDHLQQGKANKIIAHELGMSESTVKVHVRNIMRKMGATNRTQAVYKAQGLWKASQK